MKFGIKNVFVVLLLSTILFCAVGCKRTPEENTSVISSAPSSEAVNTQSQVSSKDTATESKSSSKVQSSTTSKKTSSKVDSSEDKKTEKPVSSKAETEKEEVKNLDYLNNTYYKLTKEKRLNIAYFGGSITAGYGASSGKSWRELTTTYFKKKFPNATITETNAAIGGTGSTYGIHRAVKDLKLDSKTEKPDLVFIEFAINDYLDDINYEQSKMNMECLVRMIYDYSPDTDIFIVLTTNTYFCNNLSLSAFPQACAHIDLAKTYKIPYLAVGAMLWDLTNQQIAELKIPSSEQYAFRLTYFGDGTHPSNRGYIKYAEFIKTYLEEIFEAKENKSGSLKASYKPSKAMYKLPEFPYMANFKGVTADISNAKIDTDGYLTSQSVGMNFTMKFKGTDLKIWHWSTATSGSISVSVDGAKSVVIDLYRKSANNKIFTLAKGLKNGEHTVTVTLNKTENGSGLDIRQFLISGDKEQSGIAFVN